MPSGWRSAFGKLAAEFGDDVMRAVAKVLPREATEAEARAAARTALDRITSARPEDVFAARPTQRAPVASFVVPKPPENLPPLPGRGGVSRRKTSSEKIVSDAARRVRAEARHRREVQPDPNARKASRSVYTVGPLVVQPDPELAATQLQPGSVQSITSQAYEGGLPVTGQTPFMAQHPEGYSSSWGATKPDPTNFSAEYRDRIPGLDDVQTLTGDDFKVGSGLFPMIGDATMTGRDVVSVNGMNLARPVSTFGGGRYGIGERAAGRRGVWSSDADIVAGQAKQIADWQRENPGQDVLGIHVNMAPSGSDFSHQTGAVIANLLPQLNLSDEGKRALDAYIRAGKEGLPDFEGFADDPYLGLFDMLTRPGGDRKVVTARLANVTKGAQLEGVPADLGALARLSVAEPELRFAPQGASGFSVVRFDPRNFFEVDPALLKGAVRKRFEEDPDYAGVLGGKKDFSRVDYNADLTGDVLGRTQRLLPAELLWEPVFNRAAKFTRAGKPTTAGMQFTSFKTDTKPIVTVTPELQDRVGEYLHRISRFGDLGWAEGGAVSKDLAVRKGAN